jgi:hypothetical protein
MSITMEKQVIKIVCVPPPMTNTAEKQLANHGKPKRVITTKYF